MIIPDRKKTVSIMLSKLKGPSEQSGEVANEQDIKDDGSPLKMIAEDMMTAMKSGSVMGLQEALDALVSHVQTMDEEQDEKEEGSEEQE